MTQSWTWLALVFVGVVVLVPVGMVLGAAIGEKLFRLFDDESTGWPMDDACLAGPPELDQLRDLPTPAPPNQRESAESAARPPRELDLDL
jgi:hypothetical protein